MKRQPFPHIVLDSFLPKEEYRELKKLLQELEFERKEADLFSLEQSADLSEDDKFSPLRARLLELDELLEEKFAAIVEKLDLSAMKYKKTDYLLCHDDQLEGRKVAFILYCSDHDDGGRLLLRESKEPYKATKITPKENRLVLFKVSPESWHEVEEVRGKERLSIGGWFH